MYVRICVVLFMDVVRDVCVASAGVDVVASGLCRGTVGGVRGSGSGAGGRCAHKLSVSRRLAQARQCRFFPCYYECHRLGDAGGADLSRGRARLQRW